MVAGLCWLVLLHYMVLAGAAVPGEWPCLAPRRPSLKLRENQGLGDGRHRITTSSVYSHRPLLACAVGAELRPQGCGRGLMWREVTWECSVKQEAVGMPGGGVIMCSHLGMEGRAAPRKGRFPVCLCHPCLSPSSAGGRRRGFPCGFGGLPGSLLNSLPPSLLPFLPCHLSSMPSPLLPV